MMIVLMKMIQKDEEDDISYLDFHIIIWRNRFKQRKAC